MPQTWQSHGTAAFLAPQAGQVYAPLSSLHSSPRKSTCSSPSASLFGNAMRTRFGSVWPLCSAGGVHAAITKSSRLSFDSATRYVPPVSVAIFVLMYISAERPTMLTRSLTFFAPLTASRMLPGSHEDSEERSTSTSRLPYGGTYIAACMHRL